jgi:hypothetical protein
MAVRPLAVQGVDSGSGRGGDGASIAAMRQFTAILDSAPAIRRHLESAIEPASFTSNGARLVICDKANAVMVHVHVEDIPIDAPTELCEQTLSVFVGAGAHVDMTGSGLLLALTRPGPPTILPADRRWFRSAHDICTTWHVRLLGVHVVTPRGQREVVLDDVL